MLLSVLPTYTAIILVLSLLQKCSLPTALHNYTNHYSQHSQTNKPLLDNCDFTKITASRHTTHERMFSSWVARELAVWLAVSINMHPPQGVCTERAWAASITVTFNTIYIIILTIMALKIVITAKSNIISILFFEKTRTATWNDTRWGTRLGDGKRTFLSLLNLPEMPYRIAL
jgi:hypothetical protein